MGGGDLLILKDLIPARLKPLVSIEHISCLGRCKEFGASAAPLVEVNGNVLRACSTVSVLQEIERIAEKVK
jgi:NADH:ubiquinone oxidoreductase subunit E